MWNMTPATPIEDLAAHNPFYAKLNAEYREFLAAGDTIKAHAAAARVLHEARRIVVTFIANRGNPVNVEGNLYVLVHWCRRVPLPPGAFSQIMDELESLMDDVGFPPRGRELVDAARRDWNANPRASPDTDESESEDDSEDEGEDDDGGPPITAADILRSPSIQQSIERLAEGLYTELGAHAHALVQVQ